MYWLDQGYTYASENMASINRSSFSDHIRNLACKQQKDKEWVENGLLQEMNGMCPV